MDDKMQRVRNSDKQVRNLYYIRVSARYRIVKWILLLVFSLYLSVMLLTHRESMTYENLLYLMRDFNVAYGSSDHFSSVVYEEQPNMSFASYKDQLVVAGSAELSVYSGDGTVTLSDEPNCLSPVLESSDKYLLLYDEGGTFYALYTSLACVLRENAQSLIQCAAVSDAGPYAIATRSGESKYSVSLYNASFQKIASYYRDNYVIDLSFSSDGKWLVIVGVCAEDGSMRGVVTLCRVGSDETVEIRLSDQFPLSAAYLEDGTLAVVTDTSVLLYNRDGTLKHTHPFESMILTCMNISDTHVAVVCSENILGTSSRAFVIDSEGRVLTEREFDEKVIAVTASDGNSAAYVQTQNAVYYLRLKGGEAFTASYTGNLQAICDVLGQPVFCFPTTARAAERP